MLQVISGLGSPTNGNEKVRSRLLNLLGAQMRFGEIVGNLVLFYIGAFCYIIVDLRHDPSSRDFTISLASASNGWALSTLPSSAAAS